MQRPSPQRPTVHCVSGPGLGDTVDAIAALRCGVFRDWPYLYAGDIGYERDYLARYTTSADSVFVLAFDGDRLVGASTGLPLSDDDAAFQAPFVARGIDPAAVFYFGESVLLPAYRGHGIGHAFFDRREAHASALGRFGMTAFCAVDRAPDDTRAPSAYRDNRAFWTSRGYARQEGMAMRLSWREVDAAAGADAVEHRLTFWTRTLPG